MADKKQGRKRLVTNLLPLHHAKTQYRYSCSYHTKCRPQAEISSTTFKLNTKITRQNFHLSSLASQSNSTHAPFSHAFSSFPFFQNSSFLFIYSSLLYLLTYNTLALSLSQSLASPPPVPHHLHHQIINCPGNGVAHYIQHGPFLAVQDKEKRTQR